MILDNILLIRVNCVSNQNGFILNYAMILHYSIQIQIKSKFNSKRILIVCCIIWYKSIYLLGKAFLNLYLI